MSIDSIDLTLIYTDNNCILCNGFMYLVLNGTSCMQTLHYALAMACMHGK